MSEKNFNVLILGVTGFIGRNLLDYFCKKENVRVTAHFRNKVTFALDPDVKTVVGDLIVKEHVCQVIDQPFDLVIQAAASTSGAKDIVNNPWLHVTDNAVMNSFVFRQCVEAQVKHVIFFSCTVMYQNQVEPQAESDYDPALPLHDKYFGVAHTKLYLEKQAEFFSKFGTKFSIIRHSNCYGPFDKFDLERSHFVGATLRKVLDAQIGSNLVVWGNGQEKRDLLHVSDLMEFVERCWRFQAKDFDIFNCGYGEAISVEEVVSGLIERVDKELTYSFDTNKPSLNFSLTLDCSKAREELGWLGPRRGLWDGLLTTYNWLKSHDR